MEIYFRFCHDRRNKGKTFHNNIHGANGYRILSVEDRASWKSRARRHLNAAITINQHNKISH